MEKVQESGEAIARINQLGGYLVSIICNPEYFDPEVMPAAEDWLKGEIEDIAKEYYRQKKEAATGQGDYIFNVYKKIVAFSIPATAQEGKEGQAYA